MSAAGRVLAYDDVRIPMRDGTLLAADVVVDEDAPPRPALVIRGPYSRASMRQMLDPVGFGRMGWAVVAQDVRGRFDSEGAFDPFHQERADGADTVAWAAAQPWCDGRVAMAGGSYLGATQLLAAAEQPPALRAIAPWTIGNGMADDFMYEGGAFRLGLITPWALNFAATDPTSDTAAKRRAARHVRDWDSWFAHPLDEHPLHELLPVFGRWLDRDDREYWDPLDLEQLYGRITVPAFHVAGWYDVFCEGSIRTYQGLRAQAGSDYARQHQRLIIGPWTHQGLFFNLTAGWDFGWRANAIADQTPQRIFRWLRDAIDGKPLAAGVRYFVMGSNRWRERSDWPPPSTPQQLWLDAGALRFTQPQPGTDTYDHDPADPVPTRGGRTLGPFLPLPGPCDQREVETRPDVLVYTSEPLRQPLEVAGEITATVAFASSATSADVCVKVVDVHPDGLALNVVDSVRRVACRPGRPQDVEVLVGSTAIAFGKGHRIRVEIASSNFPRLDVNPHAAHQTVHGGRSYLTLPVV